LQGSVPGLQVARIDPVAATQEYRDRIMATKGKDLDGAGKANLAEDLLSPCTEEVAVFGQFSKAVNRSRSQFVVIDTAPTGHTLLLLDAAGSYHREITRQMKGFSSLTTPLMHLQDRAQTKIIIITLAETTPVLEAEGLQEDLERAGIHPWAWVVNSSIAASQPDSVFLQRRAVAEIEQINRVLSTADRVAIIPLLTTEPVGHERLAIKLMESVDTWASNSRGGSCDRERTCQGSSSAAGDHSPRRGSQRQCRSDVPLLRDHAAVLLRLVSALRGVRG
jgi:arsenite-transporting ATPase